MSRVNVLALLYLLVFSPSIQWAAPQERAQPPKFTSGANLVLVPVVVSDKAGNHVSGLARDDFEVTQDGKQQKVVQFEEVTADAVPVQRQAASPTTFTNQTMAQHPKKLQIVVLDLLNTAVLNQSQARRGLIDFLSSSANEDALIALVVLQGNGVHLIHNFTSDRAVLAAAIRKAQSANSVRDTTTLNVAGDEDVEAAQLQTILAGGDLTTSAGGAAAQMALTRANMAATQARLDASQQSQAGLVTLECFQVLAQYFASVPGRKSLLWASTAFDFSIGSMTGALTRGTTPEDWQRTMRLLQDANIAVYPVDVGGLLATITPRAVTSGLIATGSVASRSAALEGVAAGREIDPIQSKHDTMHELADRTGGLAYYNLNDIGNLFRRAGQDSAQYYMLAFYTKDIGKLGWHKVEVKVRRQGSQVRYRTGFFVTKDMKNPESSRQADELMAMTSMLPFTSLPIDGQWQQVEPAGAKRKVHFSLSLPAGATQIDTDHENRINLDFLAVARNANGEEVARVSQQLDRRLPPAGVIQIQGNGITYTNILTMPPGQYNVSIVVRDNLSNRMGSVITPLKVD